MITAFMYSVLTKRAFVLQNLDDSFKLQDGCVDPSSISMTSVLLELSKTQTCQGIVCLCRSI